MKEKIKIIGAKAIMFIDYYEKIDDNQYQKIDSKTIRIRGSDFHRDLQEEKKKGNNIKIEYVNKRPENFAFGVVYIQNNGRGRIDYIYINQING